MVQWLQNSKHHDNPELVHRNNIIPNTTLNSILLFQTNMPEKSIQQTLSLRRTMVDKRIKSKRSLGILSSTKE